MFSSATAEHAGQTGVYPLAGPPETPLWPSTEPGTMALRRLQVRLLALLPFEWML